MDRFTGRRKLIRGSLSAPLVLTVASPAALARQSFEACLYRASQQVPNDLQVFSLKDNWVRVKVSFYTGTLQGNSDSASGGSSSGNVQAPGKQKKTKGKGAGDATAVGSVSSDERFFLKDGFFYKVAQPCGPGYSKEAFTKLVEDGTQWALVYVNDSGAIVHVGPCPPTGAFPVTGSCWASFGGGAVG